MAKASPIDRWTNGKNPLVVAFALSILPCAELAGRWLRVIARNEATKYLGPVPSLAEWLPNYSPERGAIISFLNHHVPPLAAGQSNADLVNQLLTGMEGLAADEVERLLRLDDLADARATNAWRAMAESFARYVRENLEPVMREPVPHVHGEPALPSDVQFLLRVAVPTWLLLGRSLRESLDAARAGDRKALDVLLRLDPAVMHDRQIADQIYRARHGGDRDLLHRVSLALRRKPVVPSRKTLKYLALGMLSLLSESAGIRLDGPEIRQLADALARSRSSGAMLRDIDLPEGAEALAKAIQRGRKEFDRFVKLEKLGWPAASEDPRPAPSKTKAPVKRGAKLARLKRSPTDTASLTSRTACVRSCAR